MIAKRKKSDGCHGREALGSGCISILELMYKYIGVKSIEQEVLFSIHCPVSSTQL